MLDENNQVLRSLYDLHAPPHAAHAMQLLGVGVATGAHGATIRMSDGRDVIDFASECFGYSHPTVRARVSEQMRRLPLSSRMFLSRPLAMFAKKIGELMPGDLEVSFLCNSGAEAIEGALKLARGFHPKRRRIVGMIGAYHGSTLGALGVCGIPSLRSQFSSLPTETTFVPYGDAAALEAAVDMQTAHVILEPFATADGIRVPPAGYLHAAREICTRNGALLVADEITTGLGRTGRPFGVNHDEIVPDVIVIGGALGGSVLPVAAYVTTRKINGRVYGKCHPALHGSTTGGNPSSCVAALAALEVMEDERLADRAIESGKVIRESLQRCLKHYGEIVTEFGSSGILASLRIIDEEAARRVQQRALAHGVLVRVDGLPMRQAWIGVRPPLTTSPSELQTGLTALDAALSDVSTARSRPRRA